LSSAPYTAISFACSAGLSRALPSFPARRSSDLPGRRLSRPDPLPLPLDRDRGDRLAQRPVARRGLARARATGRCARRSPRSRSSDRKSTRLHSSHVKSSYAVFCLKKKKEGQKKI